MDYVLGNPPYVRVHNLRENFDVIKEYSFAQSGMTDLYIVFFEVGIKMLNTHGTLGYITPSSYFNSVAGQYMREFFVKENLLDKIVDLRHYQAFNATTYTTITILKKNMEKSYTDYYRFDEKNLIPYFVENLSSEDFYISGNFYFGKQNDLSLLKRVFGNSKKSDISVKNGYATLCDKVFIGDFPFDSKYIIPVIKASTGSKKKIIFPYNKQGKLLLESELINDKYLYSYLLDNKDKLQQRNSEKKDDKMWFAFGRSQAISDTYKDKLSINSLIRTIDDWKMLEAPVGVGVYSGLYIISNSISIQKIQAILKTQEFISYIAMLAKYKSGGYYTFSSKDVKAFIDYKISTVEENKNDDE